MEVKGIGQGGQVSFSANSQLDTNKGQAVNNDKNENIVVNISPNGSEHRAIKEKDLRKAVEEVNKNLNSDKYHVEYEVYGKFKDITMRLVDNTTKQVIRETPPKNIIDMVTKFCEMAGMFLDQKV